MPKNNWNLSDTLQSNPCVKEVIKRKDRKYFELH